jgi:diguanylate cyclase (GGDEF)-like protein/PAS domain S-box-containing protein
MTTNTRYTPDNNQRPLYILGAGFVALLVLMAFLTALGLRNMRETQARLHDVVSSHVTKIRLVAGMRSASRERTVTLQRMLLASDPFDVDELGATFNLHGGEFARLREEYLSGNLVEHERELLRRQGTMAGMAIPLQRQVIELVANGRMAAARSLLIGKAIPAQESVYAVLDELHTFAVEQAGQAAQRAEQDYRAARWRVLWLAAIVMLLGLATAGTVFRLVRNAQHALRREKERAQVTLHSIGEGVIRTDAGGRIEYLNPVAERLTGWTLGEGVSQPLSRVLRLVRDVSREPVRDPAEAAIESGRVVTDSGDTVLVTRTGHEHALEHTAAPIRDRGGRTAGAVVVFRDVTEMRALGRELAHEASHDPMTGLLNRREFERRLQQALESARNSGAEHALCYLDLDLFKTVNDTCGHLAGDELLRQLSHELKRCARRDDALGRVGGDEFAVLLHDCSLEVAGEVAEVMRRCLRDFRFVWEDKSIDVGASIGVVRVAADSGDLNDVLRAADVACRVAKEEGRDRIHVFRANDLTVVRRQREIGWVQRLRRAMEQDRFVLYGQRIRPIAGADGDGPLCEVLLRLDDEGGRVSPEAFLHAAERYHLMPAVDRWVLQAVCRQLRGLPPGSPLSVTLNLSGQTLCDAEFLGFVERTLAETGVPARRLCFEITETAAITHMSRAVRMISALRAAGSRFLLDDFGSGLSSFNYLRNIAVDFLKIDGAFVRDITQDETDLALVSSINQVAHIMGIRTIAEYVESEAIRHALERIGVDFVQGYAIAVPQPLSALLAEQGGQRTSGTATDDG